MSTQYQLTIDAFIMDTDSLERIQRLCPNAVGLENHLVDENAD